MPNPRYSNFESMNRAKKRGCEPGLFGALENFDDRTVYPGKIVAGVDEAGRGPLAGPVVAAAVILPAGVPLEAFGGLNDSKALSEAQREKIYGRILSHCPTVGVGLADEGEIDRINILQATLQAMRRALEQLTSKPDLVLVDGLQVPLTDVPAHALVKGDSRSASIAAASIVAKVTRDRMMARFHLEFPRYRFDRHKGYGSGLHLAALKVFGPCPLHRRSYAPVARAIDPLSPTPEFADLYRRAASAAVEKDGATLAQEIHRALESVSLREEETALIRDLLRDFRGAGA